MERGLVRWLEERASPAEGTIVGLGDDACVLDPEGSGPIVLSTDQLVEGVHVQKGFRDFHRAGRKALNHALSDLAAMAAVPWFSLSSVALPSHLSENDARKLLGGVREAASEGECELMGGDISQTSGSWVVSITVVGRMHGRPAWRRAGAQVGDVIAVTGTLGGSIRGHHLDFTPRVREALWIADRASVHGAMDLSDGLSLDLDRLCRASGVSAVLDLDAIPLSQAALDASSVSGARPVDYALHDGEDFELLLTLGADEAERLGPELVDGLRFSVIGEIREGPPSIVDRSGLTVPPRGWEHLS